MTMDQLITLAVALVPMLGALAVAWLQARGKHGEAAKLGAVIEGVQRGSEVLRALSLNEFQAMTPEERSRLVKSAIHLVAEASGVEGSLRERVKKITGDPETGGSNGAART